MGWGRGGWGCDHIKGRSGVYFINTANLDGIDLLCKYCLPPPAFSNRPPTIAVHNIKANAFPSSFSPVRMRPIYNEMPSRWLFLDFFHTCARPSIIILGSCRACTGKICVFRRLGFPWCMEGSMLAWGGGFCEGHANGTRVHQSKCFSPVCSCFLPWKIYFFRGIKSSLLEREKRKSSQTMTIHVEFGKVLGGKNIFIPFLWWLYFLQGHWGQTM